MFQIVPFLLLGFATAAPICAGTPSCPILLALFAGFALFEKILGDERTGLAATQAPRPWRRSVERAGLWLYIPLQLAAILWATDAASQATELGLFLALLLGSGMTAGVFGMLAAHEMIHSRRRFERVLGSVMLAGVNYTHFRISHIVGHHRRAGTEADPATARRGESVYRFILRSVLGQLAEAWRYERRRAGGGWRGSTANRVNQGLAVAVAMAVAAAAVFGWRGLVFELGQSMIAVFFLELFNYIAHYGLMRRPIRDGRLEPFGPAHAWCAPQRLDNWVLLNAGRHAHHHRAPALGYDALVAFGGAPLLPFGIAGSMILSLVPPLWRRIMDPRLEAWARRPSQCFSTFQVTR